MKIQTGTYVRVNVEALEALFKERLGDAIQRIELESLLVFEEHMSLLTVHYSSYDALMESGIMNFNRVFNENEIEVDDSAEKQYSVSFTFNQLKPLLEELLSQQLGIRFQLSGIEDVQQDEQEQFIFLGTH